MDESTNLVQISGKLFDPLSNLVFLIPCEQRGTTRSFARIEARKSLLLPGIEPMINRDSVHLKNVGKMRCRVALSAQNNAMGTLSNSVMTTLFVNSVKQLEGFVA